MQVPLHTQSSVEAYIAKREWLSVLLPVCPLHPEGGCSFGRHGSYPRATPAGLRVARWYCPQGHCTFSLLPDFLAAGLPGLLATIGDVVARALSAKSREVAADALRQDDVTLPAALRWLRRRVRPVCAALDVVLPGGTASITGELELSGVLLDLRRTLSDQTLGALPAPVGIRRGARALRASGTDQHNMGPDKASMASYGGVTDPVRAACVPFPCHQRPPPLFPQSKT